MALEITGDTKCEMTLVISFSALFVHAYRNGILLLKLFWPIVRNNCFSDREQLLKFEAEGRQFAKFLRSLEQFAWRVMVRAIFG